MTDPVAAADQASEHVKGIARVVASFYHSLRAEDVPPLHAVAMSIAYMFITFGAKS